MKTLTFSIEIKASREKVWMVLWELANYEEWASVFNGESTAETDNWKQGSKVRFVNKERCGILSEVAANRPGEFMSFRHLGMVNNGVDVTDSEEVKNWAGAMEDYRLSGEGNQCRLTVNMDSTEEYAGYFTEKWPLALKKIKEMAER